MYVIGVSYKKAPVEVRSSFAVSFAEAEEFYRRLTARFPDIRQCVILSTCNRSEIYFDGTDKNLRHTIRFFIESRGLAVSDYSEYIYQYRDHGAIRHLIRVACGIDSMVLGEDEIYRQLKEAYAFSKEHAMVGQEFHIIFQMAMAAAKKIKSSIGISETAVSVATLAANVVVQFRKEIEKAELKVLILGLSGKTGGAVARNLLAKEGMRLTGTVRSRHSKEKPWYFSADQIDVADFAERYRLIDEADVIISATQSPHYTITCARLRSMLTNTKRRLFLDLAVPNDIEDEVVQLTNCTLYNIDYFNELAAENNAIRSQKATEAACDAEEWTNEIEKELLMRELSRMLPALKASVSEKGIEPLVFSLRHLAGPTEIAVVSDWFSHYLQEL